MRWAVTGNQSKFGLGCALSTPVTRSGAVDTARLVEHARWVQAQGCDILTVFGTTGEGASFTLKDRAAVLEAFAGAGIAAERTVLGVMATAIADAAEQARLAAEAKCRGILLTPPYYLKDLDGNGLYAWFAELFETLGAKARNVILYHIPSVTAVPIGVDLVRRLSKAFPGVVLGVKDSSCDWSNTQVLLSAFSKTHAILVGDERDLARAVREGGQGCISGLANVAPDLMLPLVRQGRDEPRVNRLVEEIGKYPVLPAVKSLIAHRTGDSGWLAVRPPLVALDAARAERLAAACDLIRQARAA
jgi:4-hydroxy-tetrahydrodipicolinate synthase